MKKHTYSQLAVFYLLMAAFMTFAGCGTEELPPRAAISFLPEGDDITASAGEVLNLQVKILPVNQIKELRIERSGSGGTIQIAMVTSLPESGVYQFSDSVPANLAAGTTLVYNFWATTTDNKPTVRTLTVTIAELAHYPEVKLGAEADTVTGHFFATQTNRVFTRADSAKNNAATVDFVYYHRSAATDSLSANGATIAAPSNARAMVTHQRDSVYNALVKDWSVKNNTKFKRAPAGTSFNQGVFSLNHSYNAIASEQEDSRISNLNTTENSLFYFRTEGGKTGIARVKELVTTPSTEAGYIILEVKVQR